MAPSLSLAFVAAAAVLSGNAEAGLYPKSSAVLSITGKTYQSLIANSNYTSIVEFYAPWCGHCKNLQPAYEKAAKQLSGLAKVAAIDCDDEGNKPFCGSMGVQGFPTLKIVRPGKKPGKPIVEDYQGARTAKGIADAVLVGIQNHVKKVSDKDVEKFESESGAKAILFSDKGTTSATLKALAIDFLGSVSVAQVRDKEKATVEKYGVTKFPTLIVVPAGAEEPLIYSGEMKKEAMVKFITESTSISPNPDPAPESAKKAKPPKGDKKSQKKFEQDSKAHKASDASSEKLKATSIKLDEEPTTSPEPAVETPKPVKVAETVNVLDVVETADDLHAKCLNPSAKICILVLLPHEEGQQALTEESSAKALLSASEVRHKLSGRGLFPFYAVKADNPLSVELRKELSLSDKVEVIATNAKRSWVRKYTKETYGVAELGEWVDAIKMNEGPKEKLPDSLIKEVEIKETKAEDPVAAPEPPSEPFIDALKEAAGQPKTAEPQPQQVPIKEGGEKYIVQDGDVMIEVEEVDDDFEIPVPTRDEL